jgi:hypothetical protein
MDPVSGSVMRQLRPHIGIVAVVALVTFLGASVTALAGPCCAADGTDTHGCSHRGRGTRTAASPDAADTVACPMHKDVKSPQSRDTQSDRALICGCTTDPETAVFDTIGLLTPTITVAPPHLAAGVPLVLLSGPAQQPCLPALPPPRVRPS